MSSDKKDFTSINEFNIKGFDSLSKTDTQGLDIDSAFDLEKSSIADNENLEEENQTEEEHHGESPFKESSFDGDFDSEFVENKTSKMSKSPFGDGALDLTANSENTSDNDFDSDVETSANAEIETVAGNEFAEVSKFENHFEKKTSEIDSEDLEQSLLKELEEDTFSPQVNSSSQTKVIQPQKNFPDQDLEQTNTNIRKLETKRENFTEIKNFAKNLSGKSTTVKEKPLFSVVFKNIKYKEDADKVQTFFETNNYGISPEDVKRQIKFGGVLISRITEFQAAFLIIQLRDIQCSVKAGRVELIHNDLQNDEEVDFDVFKNSDTRTESLNLDKIPNQVGQILTSTSSNIEGRQIGKWIKLIAVSKNIVDDSSSLLDEENEDSNKKFNKTIESLVDELKLKAIQESANAITGITVNMSPLPQDSITCKPRYKVIVTGNAVVLVKK